MNDGDGDRVKKTGLVDDISDGGEDSEGLVIVVMVLIVSCHRGRDAVIGLSFNRPRGGRGGGGGEDAENEVGGEGGRERGRM